MRALIVALCLLPAAVTAGPVVTFDVTVPAGTPAEATVFLAGNFQGWNPGQPRYALEPAGGGRHTLTLEFEPGQALQFKFTLGDWGRVEKGSAGQEIENRLHVARADTVLALTVAGWADGAARASSVTGDVEVRTWPDVLDGRRIWVYLPPGYREQADRRFPVLYMFDGQNVFDDATSFAGEWRVDETLEELIPRGEVEPLIVVAVANGGGDRALEYTPWRNPRRREATGGGAEHLARIVAEVLPRIDATYRTRTGPRNTGLAGSSFGGLMALHGAWHHADVFGRIGSFSPSLYWVDEAPRRMAEAGGRVPVDLYVDMGTRENGNLVDRDGNGTDDSIDDLRRLRRSLSDLGFIGGLDLMVVEGDGHRHNETYWARRFPAAIRFLFPGEGKNSAD